MSVIIDFGSAGVWQYSNRTFDHIRSEYARLRTDDAPANEFLDRVGYTYGWDLSSAETDAQRELGVLMRVVATLLADWNCPAGDDSERARSRAVLLELGEMVQGRVDKSDG